MTSQIYPSGKVIGYGYDDKGELVSLKIDGVAFISNIKTNDNGLLSYEYADGSKYTRTYDSNGRVTKLNYPNYTEKVNYNVVSNITAITADSMKRIFDYNNLDRLTSYRHNANDFQNFTYDGNGNRLNQSQENNTSKLFTYAENSNTLNSMVETNSTSTKEIAYEYDATGNIVKDDKHYYSYDSRNRLVAIDGNVTYQYNYDNRRVSKTVNDKVTYFIYDGHMLVGEYSLNINDDSRKEYVYLNSTPIATSTAKESYRVYSDHLDTSRRVEDSEGTIVWKWESKPFGEDEATGSLEFNLRFPGQYFDAETGTHYNINRDYNPVTGRYIQSDPIGFDGGVNGFVYVGGSPITIIDLFGLMGNLAIHSNTEPTASFDAGHAWISYQKVYHTKQTFGLWPDSHLNVANNGSGSDVRLNIELNWSANYSYYKNISDAEETLLFSILNQNHTWRYTNTCASFASETFFDVTGIDADDWGGFETPREISSSIQDINNGATVGGTQWWW
jgi:RHS repeat-associated protein